MSDDAPDLAPVLDYLRALGWDEIYAPARPRATAAAADRALRSEGLRAAREAVRQGAAGARSAESLARSAEPAAAPPRRAAAAASTERGADVLPFAFASLLAPGIPDAAADRAALLAEVGVEALSCARCKLAGGRRTVVFATGNPDADLMFVGEGPGAEEDRQGLPFVGPAGQLLTRIIQAMGFAREQVYIANVVKCRPPGNRDPQPDEVAACRPLLEAQIRLVRPKVLVALGRVAAQTLLGTDQPVARMRGHWHELLGVPLRVTYHPAAILRDAALKRPTWDDMQLVRDRLAADGATG